MTSQRQRHKKRMPLEEGLRLELQELAERRAEVEIEVHDHEDIQGGVVWVDLTQPLSQEDTDLLCCKLMEFLKRAVSENHPLATWSLVIRENGNTVRTAAWFDA